MTPEQVEKAWNLFWGFLSRTLPPNVASESEAEVNVLRSILSEVGTVWLDYGADGQGRAMLLTTVLKDEVAGSKALLIYALAIFPWATASLSDYKEGVETLKQYARAKGCLNILMYVQDPSTARFLQQLGVNATQHLLTIAV